MSEYVWNELLNDTDREVIKKGGYGKQRGFGRMPALIVNDIEPELVGLNMPIAKQLSEYPMGAGERAYKAADNILKLVAEARKKKIPVVYTKYTGKELMPFLHIQPEDEVIEKICDSAFFETNLQGRLVDYGIDTIIVTGAGTSTAGRATAVDAVTRNYNLGFVEDALFDRMKASHKTACLDVWMKFGDVVSAKEVLAYFSRM